MYVYAEKKKVCLVSNTKWIISMYKIHITTYESTIFTDNTQMEIIQDEFDTIYLNYLNNISLKRLRIK